jgi:acyl-coenzyme A thioesterase PaaI-like protein
LPHTSGCLVCGKNNPLGLGLRLWVEPPSGVVRVDFSPRVEHIGFEGIVHGGMLATVFDEAMVWASIWRAGRFCVAGEMSVRFRRSAPVGRMLRVEARVESARPRLVQTVADLRLDGQVLATAAGKYVPMPLEQSRGFLRTMVEEASTREALGRLRAAHDGV